MVVITEEEVSRDELVGALTRSPMVVTMVLVALAMVSRVVARKSWSCSVRLSKPDRILYCVAVLQDVKFSTGT